MATKARDKKTVPLGSGNNYILEWPGTLPTAEDLVKMCTPENLIGTTTGGATLSYNGTVHLEKDDFGKVQRVIIVDEEAKLKLGVFSWAPGALEKLVSTYKSTVEGNYIIHDIGGIENDDGKSHMVVFEHVDKVYGNLYVVIVGKNTAGLTLAFAKDSSTKLEPEFTAEPLNDEGRLIRIIECKPEAAAAQANTQEAG